MRNTGLSQVYLQIKNTKHCKASEHTELCFRSGSLSCEAKCFKEAASLSDLITALSAPEEKLSWAENLPVLLTPEYN